MPARSYCGYFEGCIPYTLHHLGGYKRYCGSHGSDQYETHLPCYPKIRSPHLGGYRTKSGGSFYTLEGLDTEVFDDLIAAREYEPKVEADIAAAAEAFRANFAENAPGCAIDELRFDAELDAYWSDLALHDSRFFPIEGKTQADFLALRFRYSAADEADALWLRQGADCVCVMTRNDGVWEFFNWENLPA